MERTFYYRKHLRIIKQFLWIALLPDIAIIVLGLTSGSLELAITLTLMGLIFMAGTLAINQFYKRFTTSALVINDEEVHFENNKKNITIKYEEIQVVKSASVSNLGGFFTIVSKTGEEIKLTVVIEDIGEFLLLLKAKLDERELDVYDKDKLFGFYKTARYSDDSWRRIYHAFPEVLIYVALGSAMFGASIAFFHELTVSIIFPVFIIALLLYIIIELGYYGRKTRQSANILTWDIMEFDLVKEKKVIKYLVRIPFIIIVVGFIIEIITV